MNRKSIRIITIIAIALTISSGVTYAAVAHAHSAGVRDCRLHSMTETCWGRTTHIDTITRADAWGYTRARFEYLGGIYGDTGRNVKLGTSYADTDNDPDIEGGHFCAAKELKACTYYGTASPPTSAKMLDAIDSVTYKVNVETGETTVIEGIVK